MDEQDMKAGKPSRVWKIVLVLSLALNLAVVGVVAGSVGSGKYRDGPPRSFDLGLGPISRALAPDERRDIGRSLRQDRALRDFDLQGQANEIAAVLAAEPFDQAALRELMSERARRVSDLQMRAQDAFIDVIAEMSSERRAAFAEQLTEELSRERPKRDRQSGG